MQTSEIKRLRLLASLSQADLAEKTGLSIPTIRAAERGEEVADSTLRLLAGAFNLDQNHFLKAKPEEAEPSELAKILSNSIKEGTRIKLFVFTPLGEEVDIELLSEVQEAAQRFLLEKLANKKEKA